VRAPVVDNRPEAVSIFELARLMGTSVKMIDRTDVHLAEDSEEAIRARFEARADRTGHEQASDADSEIRGPTLDRKVVSAHDRLRW